MASIAFSLPAASHTDMALDVVTALTEAEGQTVNWSMTKNGEAAVLTDELESSLIDGGGNIHFKDRGVYM